MKFKILALTLIPCFSYAADMIVSNPDGNKTVDLKVIASNSPVLLTVNHDSEVIQPNTSKQFTDVKWITNYRSPGDTLKLIVEENTKVVGDYDRTFYKGSHVLRPWSGSLNTLANINFPAPTTDIGNQCNLGDITHSDWRWSGKLNGNDYKQLTIKGEMLITSKQFTYYPIHFSSIFPPQVQAIQDNVRPYAKQIDLDVVSYIYSGRPNPDKREKGSVIAGYGDTVNFVYTVNLPSPNQKISRIAFIPYDGVMWGQITPEVAKMTQVEFYCK